MWAFIEENCLIAQGQFSPTSMLSFAKDGMEKTITPAGNGGFNKIPAYFVKYARPRERDTHSSLQDKGIR